jgi:hypothetical protein
MNEDPTSNADTIEAMHADRRGEVQRFDTVEAVLADLNAEDDQSSSQPLQKRKSERSATMSENLSGTWLNATN